MTQMREKDIAAVIERDLLQGDDAKTSDTIECFACWRRITYKASRFCSQRCRDWYDSGNPGHRQDWLRQSKTNAPFRVVAGPPGVEIGSMYHFGKSDPAAMRPTEHGFTIRCAHCQIEFESKGLRCCSTECERRHRERQDNLEVMAEVGSEPSAKRQCEYCGAAIPRWRKGRRVSRATRFCSDRCSRKANRPP
jgi:hypothetical protein